ncbi:MAG: hypothetical protein HC887_00475 [Desulfobacteraceae bacterium]|nr:hypothetical protein [Desulfobacteraceae bacterium]
MRVIFYDEGDVVKDPKTGEILDSDSRELGVASIRKLLPKMSYAVPYNMDIVGKLNNTHKAITK